MNRVVVLFLGCSFSVGLRLHSQPNAATSDTRGKYVVCTQVKDEMPYLFEWIEFHRTLGVDQFDIYNHHSSDGIEHLPQLYNAAGKPYVSVLTAQAQDWSFTNCIQRHKNAAWVGIFDVDEFISLQPNSSRPLCEGSALRCFLDQHKQYAEVHFPTLRFSSNKQVWRQRTPVQVSLQQLSTGTSSVSDDANTPLNCKELSLHKQTGPTYNPCRSESIPTITGSHIFRGPSEDIKGDNYNENFKNTPNCHDLAIQKEANAPVCRHGPGKSFVQPHMCAKYMVHGCNTYTEELKVSNTATSKGEHSIEHKQMQSIYRFNVPITDARLNHYYTRSAEDACKHANGWKNSAPLAVYKYVDDGFFKLIKDETVNNAVPQKQLQEDISRVLCPKPVGL